MCRHNLHPNNRQPEELTVTLNLSFGTWSEAAGGVLFQTQHGDLVNVARYLRGLNLPFVIHHPPELRQEVLRMAELLLRSAQG